MNIKKLLKLLRDWRIDNGLLVEEMRETLIAVGRDYDDFDIIADNMDTLKTAVRKRIQYNIKNLEKKKEKAVNFKQEAGIERLILDTCINCKKLNKKNTPYNLYTCILAGKGIDPRYIEFDFSPKWCPYKEEKDE